MDNNLTHSHSATRGASSAYPSEQATCGAPCSRLPPAEDQREVVLKDIVVKSSPTDGTHLERLTLTIFGLSEQVAEVLDKISPNTWKCRRSVVLEPDIEELMFVAQSEDAGDLGYLTLGKGELVTLMATDGDAKLERRFVTEEGRPLLEMMFTIAVSRKATPDPSFNTGQNLEQLSGAMGNPTLLHEMGTFDTPGTSGSNGTSPPEVVMGSVESTPGGTVTGSVDTSLLPSGLPRLFALVIGIDQYLSLPKLAGAVNDAKAVELFLKMRLNVPGDRIRLLLDDQASREGILSELRGLSDRHDIERGDPILIYYAGHGTQLPSPPTWDAGGPGRKIQGIGPCDYLVDHVQAIPDRTIGGYLNRICEEKGDNITVIFDCCFSASGTRTDVPTTDVRGVILNDELSTELDRDTSRGITSEIPVGFGWRGRGSHILLAACKETESAREHNQRGRFTAALLKLFQSDSKLETLTYTDILKQIERIPGQNPQVEGMHRNRFLFNAKATRRQFHSVRFEDRTYVMDAGSIHGVTLNSQFTVYRDYDRFLDSTPWGILFISRVEPSTSLMGRCEGEFENDLDKPGIAVLSTGGADQTITIEVCEDLPSSFQESLEEMKLRRLISIEGAAKPGVQLEDGRKAELQLQLKDGHVVFNILDRVVSDYGLKSIYHTLPSISPKADIVGVLSAGCHFYWHLRRKHAHPIAEDVQVEFLELAESSDEVDKASYPIIVATENNMLRDGVIELSVYEKPTMYGIKLTNQSKWDLFPVAFYFDNSDWSIETYYHPGTAGQFQPEPPLRKQGGTLTIGYGCGGGDPISFRLDRENQDIDVGHLKIFLSTKPAELRNVEQVSPFTGRQRTGRRRPAASDTWIALQYPIVQHRA